IMLLALRAERFDLMARLAELPTDMMFFTQITMEAAEDPDFLDAMQQARIIGALVGVEAVTTEGLKAVYQDFNLSGDNLVQRLRTSGGMACMFWGPLSSACPPTARTPSKLRLLWLKRPSLHSRNSSR